MLGRLRGREIISTSSVRHEDILLELGSAPSLSLSCDSLPIPIGPAWINVPEVTMEKILHLGA